MTFLHLVMSIPCRGRKQRVSTLSVTDSTTFPSVPVIPIGDVRASNELADLKLLICSRGTAMVVHKSLLALHAAVVVGPLAVDV